MMAASTPRVLSGGDVTRRRGMGCGRFRAGNVWRGRRRYCRHVAAGLARNQTGCGRGEAEAGKNERLPLARHRVKFFSPRWSVRGLRHCGRVARFFALRINAWGTAPLDLAPSVGWTRPVASCEPAAGESDAWRRIQLRIAVRVAQGWVLQPSSVASGARPAKLDAARRPLVSSSALR